MKNGNYRKDLTTNKLYKYPKNKHKVEADTKKTRRTLSPNSFLNTRIVP